MKLIRQPALLAAALGLSLSLLAPAASAEMSAADKIKIRQSGYTFIAWNMGKIYAQVIEGSVPFDAKQVAAAANAIAAIANSGMGVLHTPGTDHGTGWEPTRLKSNFFDDPEMVKQIAGDFSRETTKLAEVAQGGDKDAIAVQFKATGKTCKACHENYRAEEEH